MLLASLNDVNNPRELLSKLNDINFDASELTEEGDSVLHVLAQSKHAKNQDFYDYVKELIEANANDEAINDQGKNFLDCYLLHTPFFDGRILGHYLKKATPATNHSKILKLVQSQPQLLLQDSAPQKTLLAIILLTEDLAISTEESQSLINSCKNLPDSSARLKETISACFREFQQGLVSNPLIIKIASFILALKLDIDVEYCLAMSAFSKDVSVGRHIITMLKTGVEPINTASIISHIRSVGTEGSKEELEALKLIHGMGLILQAWDPASLAVEELCLKAGRFENNFSQDTNNFGHLFSLSGNVPGDNGASVPLTGSTFRETSFFMARLMAAFSLHAQRDEKYRTYLSGIEEVTRISRKTMRLCLLNASIKDYPFLDRKMVDSIVSSMLNEWDSRGVEIPTGWYNHAIILYVKGEEIWRVNGGSCSTDAAIEKYKIRKNGLVSGDFLRGLVNLDPLDKTNTRKDYIQRQLHEILDLEYIGPVSGDFQTVGNCAFHSLVLSLKGKLRTVFSEKIADELYHDALAFFEDFYLKEYLSAYANHVHLPHVLMRLIIQNLLPRQKFKLARELISTHFSSDPHKEILYTELMIRQWLVRDKPELPKFKSQLQMLGVRLTTENNPRLQLLERFLNNSVSDDDFETLLSWPVDKLSFNGYQLLHIAVSNDNVVLALKLLDMFSSTIDKVNWYGKAPLHDVKSVEMLKLLVSDKADRTNIKMPKVVDCAICLKNPELVGALLDHGAILSEHSANYAASDKATLEVILKRYPEFVRASTPDGSTAMHFAAASDNAEALLILLKNGANPNQRSINGVTPLYRALRLENLNAAQALAKCPYTVFAPPYRRNSLKEYTQFPDEDLQNIFDQSIKDHKEHLEIFSAFKLSDNGVVKEEVDYIIVAILTDQLDAIPGCLLTYPEIKVTRSSALYSKSPLSTAIEYTRGKSGKAYECAFMLVKSLFLTISDNDINSMMLTKEPHLFMATTIGDVNVLDLFLNYPSLDPNLQDRYGYTALHDAVERGHLDCVQRLLKDHRVNIQITNIDGKTAADLTSSKEGVQKCINAILEHQRTMQKTLTL